MTSELGAAQLGNLELGELGMAIEITCGDPPSGYQGIAYSHVFPTTDAEPPLVFAITAGALPTGLTLNTVTGEVSGIPTTAGVFSFTVQVTDSLDNSDTVPCSITIATNLAVGCGDPPVGYVGVAYSNTCPASGGTAPYVFSISAGALPAGLTIGAGTGVISGTPTTKGTATFTVLVTDALDNEVSVACSITIRGKCLSN